MTKHLAEYTSDTAKIAWCGSDQTCRGEMVYTIQETTCVDCLEFIECYGRSASRRLGELGHVDP